MLVLKMSLDKLDILYLTEGNVERLILVVELDDGLFSESFRIIVLASSAITWTRTSYNNSIFSPLSSSLLPTSERQAAWSPYGRHSTSSSHSESVRSFLIHLSTRPASVSGPTYKMKVESKARECLIKYQVISLTLTSPKVLKARVMSTFCAGKGVTMLS